MVGGGEGPGDPHHPSGSSTNDAWVGAFNGVGGLKIKTLTNVFYKYIRCGSMKKILSQTSGYLDSKTIEISFYYVHIHWATLFPVDPHLQTTLFLCCMCILPANGK